MRQTARGPPSRSPDCQRRASLLLPQFPLLPAPSPAGCTSPPRLGQAGTIWCHDAASPDPVSLPRRFRPGQLGWAGGETAGEGGGVLGTAPEPLPGCSDPGWAPGPGQAGGAGGCCGRKCWPETLARSLLHPGQGSSGQRPGRRDAPAVPGTLLARGLHRAGLCSEAVERLLPAGAGWVREAGAVFVLSLNPPEAPAEQRQCQCPAEKPVLAARAAWGRPDREGWGRLGAGARPVASRLVSELSRNKASSPGDGGTGALCRAPAELVT